MAELGLAAYRFSVSWPRIQPTGRGPANRRGLDFYRRLVDELLGHGIEPWLTLYHWDLPQALEDAGGWPARDTAERFADYAALVHGALGDRVRNWTTLNEPWCAAFLGYASGEHAPGRQRAGGRRCARRTTCCSGTAWPRRRCGPAPATRGWRSRLNLYPVGPASDSAGRPGRRAPDRRPAEPALPRRRCCAARYPADVLADVAGADRPGPRPGRRPGDHRRSRWTLLGRQLLQPAGRGGRCRRPGRAARPGRRARRLPPPFPGSEHVGFVPQGRPRTAMDWEIDAAGLTEVLIRVGRDYPAPPLYVTENGAAFADTVSADGRVHDPERIAYLAAHLRRLPGRDRGRGGPARLLRLVAAGQLRVGVGLRRCASASCTSTSPPSAGCSRTARCWYADSARRNAPAPLSRAPDVPGSPS